jgi:hypothetical protein
LLAVDLASYYDQPVTPQMQTDAAIAYQFIAGLNSKPLSGAFGESQTLTSPNIGTPAPQPGAPSPVPVAAQVPPGPGQ